MQQRSNPFPGAVPLDPKPKKDENEFSGEGAIELSRLTLAVWQQNNTLIEIHGDQAASLRRIADAATSGSEPTPHIYAIAPQTSGRWGVFCLACTREVGEYVMPCALQQGDVDAPPASLVPAPEFVENPPNQTPS